MKQKTELLVSENIWMSLPKKTEPLLPSPEKKKNLQKKNTLWKHDSEKRLKKTQSKEIL